MPLDVVLPVLGLALLDTLSPAVIGVSLFVLLSGRRRIAAPLLVFLTTVALFYFAVGVALMLGLDVLLGRVDDILENRAVTWGQAVVGAALLAFSFLPKRYRTRGSARRREPGTDRELRAPVMIGLGLGAGVLEVGMVLPYMAAIGIMTVADLPATEWVPLMATYNVIMVAPPLLLYAAHRLLHGWIEPRMLRWRERLRGGSAETVAWMAGIIGALLLLNALPELL
ncbi:GAP family protein [Phytoactinopolyspora limicola]|uniref:GAP family protein n=1 Tax=Phytoactinopolyspora limicola TaxID=2715536 RepID=UPI001409ADBD|nr:GAP family protein [Phytoactinopolyspora limicola]